MTEFTIVFPTFIRFQIKCLLQKKKINGKTLTCSPQKNVSSREQKWVFAIQFIQDGRAEIFIVSENEFLWFVVSINKMIKSAPCVKFNATNLASVYSDQWEIRGKTHWKEKDGVNAIYPDRRNKFASSTRLPVYFHFHFLHLSFAALDFHSYLIIFIP